MLVSRQLCSLSAPDHFAQPERFNKRIVNLNRIQGFNSVNLRNGYPLLEIRMPQEVLS